MNIIFKNIKFKNFLSYGDEYTEFNFNNGMDLINAPNGNGKSSISSAIFYALFGKADRKIKNGSLINNITGKNLEVILDFNVDNKSYRIIRGQKPNKFEIYELIDSTFDLIKERASVKDYQVFLEEDIIKINELVYRQLVSLTANLPTSKPFMELSSSEKEQIFQTIMDTSIFNDLKSSIKVRVQDKKLVLKDLEYKRNILDSSIISERNMIEQLEKQNKDFLEHHNENINRTKENILSTEENIKKYTEGLEKLKELKSKYDNDILDLNNKISKLDSIKSKISSYKNELNKIQSAESGAITCKHCSNINYLIDVDVSSKESILFELKELESDFNILNSEISNESNKMDLIKEKLLNAKRIKNTLDEHINNLEYYKSKLEELENIKVVQIDYTLLNEKEDSLKIVNSELEVIRKEIDDLLYIDNLIGDNNIKGLIIQQQIPLLNKGINSFLEMFSLLDYNFIIDENFKEKIISKGSDTEFHQLSNGQKARISFAIMFAFLKLIEDRNGVKINLLVLDEVLDSSIDFEGREELLDILREKFSITKNVIVISHSDQIKQRIETFNRIITVQKDKFSSIKVEEC